MWLAELEPRCRHSKCMWGTSQMPGTALRYRERGTCPKRDARLVHSFVYDSGRRVIIIIPCCSRGPERLGNLAKVTEPGFRARVWSSRVPALSHHSVPAIQKMRESSQGDAWVSCHLGRTTRGLGGASTVGGGGPRDSRLARQLPPWCLQLEQSWSTRLGVSQRYGPWGPSS